MLSGLRYPGWYWQLVSQLTRDPGSGLNAWLWMPDVFRFRIRVCVALSSRAPYRSLDLWLPPGLARDRLLEATEDVSLALADAISGASSLPILLGILRALSDARPRNGPDAPLVIEAASGGRPCPILRT